jgi:hypothetical protein
MAPRLQRMLAEDWELLAYAAGRAMVEPGRGATLQYRLDVRQRATGETTQHLVAGRLFATLDAAMAWRSDVDLRADRLGDRADLRALRRPTAVVQELRLVLHALPLDPLLPGLVLATDPPELLRRLGPELTSSVPGLVLQGCRAEVVRYGPGSCVLRYELSWRLQPSRRRLKQVVYGKVYADERGRLVGPAVTSLRQQEPDGPGSALPFVVPRFQAYLPDVRLALLDAVPGSPLLSALIRARTGTGGPGPTPEGAVTACARIAAALHRSAVPVGASRSLGDEVDGVRAAVAALAPLAPTLAESLHTSLAAIDGAAAASPGSPGVAHGDFHPSQVLFDGPTVGLVDFDTMCRAEPALDLGQFTGHLAAAGGTARAAVGAAGDGPADLVSTFLREYLRLTGTGDPDALLARVAAYRTVMLAQLAVRRWCQLKPQGVRPVLSLLDRPSRSRISVP